MAVKRGKESASGVMVAITRVNGRKVKSMVEVSKCEATEPLDTTVNGSVADQSECGRRRLRVKDKFHSKQEIKALLRSDGVVSTVRPEFRKKEIQLGTGSSSTH
jgi:hypothetical protein